jgi:pimeloyl-ACP methyl ester carboxylesterase
MLQPHPPITCAAALGAIGIVVAAVVASAAGLGQEKTPAMREAHATLPGVRLWYRDSGGTGTPIVLLHAFTGDSRVWDRQFSAFTAAGYRVIAYDRRGFGRSEADPTAPQPGTGADDLQALLDHLGLDRIHLIGTAAGGFVALDFTVSFAGRLRSLVFANSMGLIQDEDFLEVGRRIRPPKFEELPAEFRELSPSYRASDPEGTRRWSAIASSNRPPGPPLNQRVRNRMTGALLAGITVPTLIISGEADLYMPPPLMRMIAARIPGSETAVVPETAHSAFWEQPEAFNRLVLAFLAKH